MGSVQCESSGLQKWLYAPKVNKALSFLDSEVVILRGLVQTICGKISVIVMFGERGVESSALSLAFTLQKH